MTETFTSYGYVLTLKNKVTLQNYSATDIAKGNTYERTDYTAIHVIVYKIAR